MKELLSTDFEVTVNNASATVFYGDGTNITGVETLPYYSWTGLIRVTDTTSTLIKLQGDDYFGDLNITSPYNAVNGVDITSTNGSIFTNNKTFLIPPVFIYEFITAYLTTVNITDTTINLKLGNDGSSVPPFNNPGVFSSFEIKVFK